MASSRQQQHSNQQRQNRGPEGDALAIIPTINASGEKDTLTLELGPVWRSDKGNLTFKLHLFPLQWLDPNHPRTIVIKMREAK